MNRPTSLHMRHHFPMSEDARRENNVVLITNEDPFVVNESANAPQPCVHGMIWRVTIAVLLASAAGCSSDSDGNSPGGGSGGASSPDGGAGTAGNSSGAGNSSAGAGASGGPGQGGNATGAGGAISGGRSSTGSGGSSGVGGSNVGGATLTGGRTGTAGGSSGAGGSVGGCTSVGSSCDPDTTICCPGAVCVTSTSPDYAGCREECTTAADCTSGCCIPFANIPNKGFCGAAALCQCAGQDETCGGTRQCCGGFSCSTFDGTGALACHKACAQNSDCSTNCCVQVQGTADKVCLPAKPFCGP
jgi:hypothetical protein